MIEARISDQCNDVLSRNLTSPAKQKLATEESTAKSQNLTLNCSMSIVRFHNTVQSLSIQSQEILTSANYLP